MKKIGIIICLLAFVSSQGIAQEVEKKEKVKSNKEKIEIKVKEGEANPLIIIDGKEYDFDILNIIDKDKIESVSVLKGEEARDAYDAANGVIIITSKSEEDKAEYKIQIRENQNKKMRIHLDGESGDEKPVIVIDGNVEGKEAFDDLSPDDIVSITVLKDEKAKKKYNTEAGVILIVTKKKK